MAASIILEERAYVGLGANIIQGLRIGRMAVVGAGAVVTKDVAERTLVVGVPARVVQNDIDGL